MTQTFTNRFRSLALGMTALVVGAALTLGTALALEPNPRRGEQNEARQQLMAGKVKSLREIEARILPRMRGMQYIGPEYDPVSQVYRLKFLKDNRVVFVDIDAATGAVIRQIN